MSEESIRQELKIKQDEIQRKLSRIDEIHGELNDLEAQADELLENFHYFMEKNRETEVLRKKESK